MRNNIQKAVIQNEQQPEISIKKNKQNINIFKDGTIYFNSEPGKLHLLNQ